MHITLNDFTNHNQFLVLKMGGLIPCVVVQCGRRQHGAQYIFPTNRMLPLHPLIITQSDNSDKAKDHSFLTLARQFLTAMLVVDAWNYFMHRYLHHNKFLYKHIHSYHHRLVVPYAFGALYNHPLEGLLMDIIGGSLSFFLSGMSPRASIFFFSFTTIKGIDDHCGLWLPGNVFRIFFTNNTAYHDIHHQLYGTKYNFSQPFFSFWDRILGTYMAYSVVKRVGGGFEARPANDYKEE
ncbi:sphingolipid C4-monooxygenase [Ranunculus cassubicifolius]